MSDLEATVIASAITAAVAWWCYAFYWGRVLFCSICVLGYAGIAIVAPILAAVRKISEGDYFLAAAAIAVGVIVGAPFWFVLQGVVGWIKYQRETDGLLRPWNER